MNIYEQVIDQHYFFIIIFGIRNTIFIWIFAMLISFSLGFRWGFLRGPGIYNAYITATFNYIAYIAMVIPAQIHFFFFSYFFALFNVSFNDLIAALALGVYSSAFTSEIVVSAFETISFSQWKLIHNIEKEHNRKEITSALFLPPLNSNITRMLAHESEHILKHIPFLSFLSVFEFNRSVETIFQINKNHTSFYLYMLIVYGSCSLLIRAISLFTIRKADYEEHYKS